MSSRGVPEGDLLVRARSALLVISTETADLAAGVARLLADDLSGETTAKATDLLRNLFAAGPDAVGSAMAGRAEEGVGEPATVALQTSILAADLLAALAS